MVSIKPQAREMTARGKEQREWTSQGITVCGPQEFAFSSRSPFGPLGSDIDHDILGWLIPNHE